MLLPPVLRLLHVTALEGPQAIIQPRVTAAWWRASGAVALFAVSWLLAGPPWHVAAHHREIDFHEQVHLGPLQAIDKGYVPFVGPASTQYGPGTQLLTYTYMKWTDQFDIVGFREANLVQHFATTLVVCLLAWSTIGFPGACAVLILGLSFSPLQFFLPAGDGTFQGFYGWASGLRYLGALVVVPLTVRRMLVVPAGRMDWRLLVIGVTAGVFAWLAQENLSATVAALLFVLVLMMATRTITWRAAASTTAQVAAGSTIVAMPIVVYYLLQGELSRFVRNYFLVPRAVATGFSNTWWLEGPADPRYRAYAFTTAVIVVIGIAAVWNVREMRLRHPLTGSQVRLLAYLGVFAASYHTALYRADSSHLVNTMIAAAICPGPGISRPARMDRPDSSGEVCAACRDCRSGDLVVSHCWSVRALSMSRSSSPRCGAFNRARRRGLRPATRGRRSCGPPATCRMSRPSPSAPVRCDSSSRMSVP